MMIDLTGKSVFVKTQEEYLSVLEQIGVRRMEEIHQAAYDRWVEAGQ